MTLVDIVNHDKDVIKDKRYNSLFDDKKRLISFSKNITFKNIYSSCDTIWNLIELFVLKDLRTIDTNEKLLLKNLLLKNKKNKEILYKVVNYEQKIIITLKTKIKDVVFFAQYKIIKTNRKKIVINLSEVAIYPYIIFGPSGALLKHKTSNMFKQLCDSFSEYILNNYIKK